MTIAKMLVAALGAGALALATVGCGGSEPPPPQPAPQPQPQPQPIAQEPVQQPVQQQQFVEEWVQMPVRILFTNGGAELSAENQALLDEAVATMRARNDIVRVRIEGHADTQGADGNNAQLSLMRAQAVMNFLVSRGVPQSMLEAVGYGSERPLVREFGSEQNRAQNRRVEFSALIRRPAGQTTTTY